MNNHNRDGNGKIVISTDELANVHEPISPLATVEHGSGSARQIPVSNYEGNHFWLIAIPVSVLCLLAMGFLVFAFWQTGGNETASLHRQSKATLDYWKQLQQIGNSLDQAIENMGEIGQASDLEKVGSHCDAAAQSILALSMRNVDSDAILAGENLVRNLKDVAIFNRSFAQLTQEAQRFSEYSNSAEVFIESFMRGLTFDPLHTVDRLQDESEEIKSRYQDLMREFEDLQKAESRYLIENNRIRAKLTEKFGIDFPNLE